MAFRIVHAVSDMVSRNVRRSKLRTTKVLDRLTFCPAKHKRKEARGRIKALQDRQQPDAKPSPPDNGPDIKFGSFNINGMSAETGWAIGELLRTRNFDVRH